MKYLLTCIFLLAATSFLAAQTFHIQGNIERDKGELLVLTQQVEGMDTLGQTKFEQPVCPDRQFAGAGSRLVEDCRL